MSAGRKTTGRYETREELERVIFYWWLNTPANQTEIAKVCRVSQSTVSNILTAIMHRNIKNGKATAK